ncbi:MAG: alpha-amylase family glycosyl hydrolase [Verrucomicrobia bacterium]|jgi:hypothetical protein|nr:alpha-amylase family glycosyl hydrolase [Verrucomicrobiota bacterium]
MNQPFLLELNTRCWLRELPSHGGQDCTLASVPDSLVEDWAAMGLTHIWLMGVWATGPHSRGRALAHAGLREVFNHALPDWREGDVAGSPYAIARYQVSDAVGGEAGLQMFRQQLHRRGLKLILDFVPNHLGLDHPWVQASPDYFVQSTSPHPYAFPCETAKGRRWIVHGKDPYFPPWDDTVQLDYRLTAVHQAMRDQWLRIAGQCDGVRCDMAMLLLREVFEQTWRDFPPTGSGAALSREEFWPGAIASVRAVHPEFLVMGEAYWGLEGRLQELGFDYTYDKGLTDHLLGARAVEAVRHLQSKSAGYLRQSVHFLENHDEERVASVLGLAAHRAAALLVLALPGMRFLHDGQTGGATVRTPVQLIRRKPEPVNPEVRAMYARLLAALQSAGVGNGEGCLLQPQAAWPDNPTWENLVLVRWGDVKTRFALAVVNLAPHRSQCRVAIHGLPADPKGWDLVDLLGDEHWRRASHEMREAGLFLDVAGHAAQLFRFQPADPSGNPGEARKTPD